VAKLLELLNTDYFLVEQASPF